MDASGHWVAPIAVCVAGAVGGLTKTLMTGAGEIPMASAAVDTAGVTVWRPGWMVNPFVGAVAALVSWALYGAAAGRAILDAIPGDLTWANFAAAVMVGIGGAGWLSAEVDKNIFKKTAVEAAKTDADPSLAATITSVTPDQALKAATAASRK